MEYRKLILAGLLGLTLTGCACTNPTVIDRPVVQPWPEPLDIKRPQLQLNNQVAESEMIRSLNVIIEQLIGYSKELETGLDVYKTQPTDTTK